MAAAIFVLILLSVFHGYVSGYPAKGMLKIINIFLSLLSSFFQFIFSHGIISFSSLRLDAFTLELLAKT